MGGWLAIRSQLGKGTSIRVFLPKARITRVQRRDGAEPEAADHTVLVVDDSVELLEMITDTLSRTGYRVLSADSAKDGLKLYREHADEITLSVLDAVMRDSGGDRVLREIIRREPQANVVMTSVMRL